ncbi:MAG: B12-binding domain-containing radical SAM protein, partial [Chloroflexi bacterium]|nr:B12-binding domain-containing radical SAM protein [Chloroflexota bacterium]
MNILLVYPEFPETFWSFRHALKFIGKKASMPPLGLLTVASMLPPDWQLRLVDMNVQRLSRADLEWADCVFLSAMVAQSASAHEVADRCQAVGTPVVAGGPLFSGEHEAFPGVAHFILGEAEVTLPLFLADLAGGQPQRIYRSDEKPALSQTPPPRWDLVDMGCYASMCIQFSRGCPFNCDFCNITALFGRTPRVKSAPQLMAELEALYQAGGRGDIFFVDDNFIGNRRALKEEVLPALIRWRQDKPHVSFSTEVSINLADDAELLRLMVEAGFTTVFIGIETPDEESLAECSKIQNRGRDLVACVRRLHQAGLDVQGGFIVGFDSDRPNIFDRQIRFIQESGIVTAMVGLLQAPHGTRLYERLRREGRLLRETSGNNTDTSMNFIPCMDLQVLTAGYQRIVETIYDPEAYYQRVKTFLRQYMPADVVRPRIRVPELGAFFKSICLLGIRGRERAQYWRLLFWTLFRRPR